MKRNTIYLFLAFALAFLAMPSCMDYDEPGDELKQTVIVINDSIYHGTPNQIVYDIVPTKESVDTALKYLDNYFSMAITGQYAMRGGKNGDVPGAHAYQRQFSFASDIYSQYSTIPHFDFMYGTLTSSYAISLEFNGGPNSHYLIVKNAIAPILNHPMIDSIPEMKAIYLLLLDCAAQEVADIYGPFPYFQFTQNYDKPPFVYNTVETIYGTIVNDIDKILACLNNYDSRPDWYKEKVQDCLYSYMQVTQDAIKGIEGMETWKRFANSLKLRIAVHCANVAPDKAQRWAEEAVAAGVIESVDNEVVLDPSFIGFTNPLLTIWNTWNDARLSASFESLLMSLKHPYADYIFEKNTIDLQYTDGAGVLHTTPADSRIYGLREGINPGQGQSVALNTMLGASKFITDFVAESPLYIMKLSEVCFLRAEGAIRGWNMGGNAEDFYYQGIDYGYMDSRVMYNEMGSPYKDALDDYNNLVTPVNYTYVDALGKTPDMPSVTKIGVKWNDADDRETKLEKIITQKYLAAFPCSFEAWVDLRRTGYPKLFPVLNADEGDGTLRTGDIIRRMVFPNTDDSSQRDIERTGLDSLGGEDWQSTRLWWDVDGPNF